VTTGMVGRRYLLHGQPVTVLARWAVQPPCSGGVIWHRPPKRTSPRNVLIKRADGSLTVRPARGLRRLPTMTPGLCCAAECPDPSRKLGRCIKHYERFRRYGTDELPVRTKLAGREETIAPGQFWARVNKNGPIPAHVPELGPCWLWGGYVNKRGYGQYTRRQFRTHRIAYALAHGPIPDGMVVCHRCDNPTCVRLDHLFLGTDNDNVQDRVTKQRQGRSPGERNGSAKLSERDVAAIRALKGQMFQREIAEQFGVTQTCVSKIHRGKRWNAADAA
jgi:hypothetical protein